MFQIPGFFFLLEEPSYPSQPWTKDQVGLVLGEFFRRTEKLSKCWIVQPSIGDTGRIVKSVPLKEAVVFFSCRCLFFGGGLGGLGFSQLFG